MEPICPEAPKTVLRQVQMDLNDTFYPEKPLVPYIKVTQDRCVLEIQRGCTRGCRFCQAVWCTARFVREVFPCWSGWQKIP